MNIETLPVSEDGKRRFSVLYDRLADLRGELRATPPVDIETRRRIWQQIMRCEAGLCAIASPATTPLS